MATEFFPGQTLERKDLSIFLVDSNSNPITAFEISYAIYFVDPGPPETEVLIGSATRTPVNPQVGEYYAALMVPPGAQGGTYRIRWTFRQYANSPQQTVTQEFTVVANEEATTVNYSPAVRELIWCLRVLLRDQCVAGEELVEIDVDGERELIRLDNLWEVIQNPTNP